MKFAITGGIGSGKSYLCHELADAGIDIYNCDDEAKRLMTSDAELITAIKQLVGNDAYLSDGTLNKPRISAFIFSTPENIQKMNAIVHPAVLRDFTKWAEGKRTCIMESAILFESGFNHAVDKVILVHANKDVRLRRAMSRDHATREQILERMDKQIPDQEALARADYIFDNTNYHTKKDLNELLIYITSLC